MSQDKKTDNKNTESSSKPDQNANKPSTARVPPTIDAKAKDLNEKQNLDQTKNGEQNQQEKSKNKPEDAAQSKENTDKKTVQEPAEQQQRTSHQAKKDDSKGKSKLSSLIVMFLIGLPLGVAAGYIGSHYLLGSKTGAEEKIAVLDQNMISQQTQLAALTKDINSLKTDLKALNNDETAQALSQQVEDIIGNINQLNGDMSSTQSRIDEISKQANDIDQLTLIQNNVNEVSGELQRLSETVQTLTSNASSNAAAETTQSTENVAVNANDNVNVSALEDRLKNLSQKQQALSDQLDSLNASQSKIATQAATALENEKAMDASLSQNTQQIETMKANIAALEEKMTAAGSANMVAKSLALQYAQSALERDQIDLHKDLSLLSAVGFSQDKIDQLQRINDQGIASMDMLKSSFDNAEKKVLSEGTKAQEDIGDKILGSLKNSFGVRRTGLVEGESSDAILARARYYLSNGEVENALDQVKSLSDEAKMPLEAWIKQAQNRLDAKMILAELNTEL